MGADGAVIQIGTRYGSVDEFIERFAPFTTETDIVVPALSDVSEGSARHFIICLEDGSVIMKGRCEVTDVRPVSVTPGDAPAPTEPALMRLRLREMDAHSAGIHLRLMEWHAFSPQLPAAAIPEGVTSSLAASAAEGATTSTPPLPQNESEAAPADIPVDLSAVTVVRDGNPSSDTETTTVSPLPSPETGAPRAAFTLPAIRLDRALRIGRRVAPYASGLIVGLLLGIMVKPSSKTTPVAVAPNLAPPPVVAAPPVAAPPPVAARPPSAAPVPADDPTPASRHAVGAQPQLAKVMVTSSPARALIKVNKHRMGRAPREISARRFERVRIEASLPGYQRWKKTIYVEEAELKLEVKLVRTRELEARGATPPMAPPSRATPPSSAGVPSAVAAR